MSTVELRRRLIAEIKDMPADKLATVVNYVAFVLRDPEEDPEPIYKPAFIKAIKEARAQYEAGNFVNWDSVRGKFTKSPPRRGTRKSGSR